MTLFDTPAPKVIAAALTFCAPAPALADEACDGLHALAAAAQAGFVAAPQPPFPGGPPCSLSLSPDGSKVGLCRWKHDFRAAAAQEDFERFDQSIRSCLPSAEALPADQPVNHPDSYEIRRYQVGDAKLFLSIKDKATHRATYVFIRAESAADF